jgi:hypothetical protein
VQSHNQLAPGGWVASLILNAARAQNIWQGTKPCMHACHQVPASKASCSTTQGAKPYHHTPTGALLT